MKEIILQKSNFRCRENIYICRPLRRLRRLAVEYVKKCSTPILKISNSLCFFKIRGTSLIHFTGDIFVVLFNFVTSVNRFNNAIYLPGLPLIREKSGKFKVREKSGNYRISQGNLEFS